MSTEPILAAALAVSALVALFFFWQRGRGAKAHNRFVGLTGSSSVLLTFAVAAIATFFWEEISCSASEKGLGEPVLFFHGVSLWPAVVLRALAAIAAILLICDAWRELNFNLHRISERLSLTPPEVAVQKAKKELNDQKIGLIPWTILFWSYEVVWSDTSQSKKLNSEMSNRL